MIIAKLGFCIILGVIIGWIFCLRSGSSSEAHVKVFNESGQDISKLDLVVCKNRFSFSELPKLSTLAISFPVNGESGYQIKVFLASGITIENNVGYVTRGLTSSDEIVVTPSKIIIRK